MKAATYYIVYGGGESIKRYLDKREACTAATILAALYAGVGALDSDPVTVVKCVERAGQCLPSEEIILTIGG
jgi:hypothetical protein